MNSGFPSLHRSVFACVLTCLLCATQLGRAQGAASWNVTTVSGIAGSTGSADGAGGNARFNGPRAMAIDSAGAIYVADTFNHVIRKISPSGEVTTIAGAAGSSGAADGNGGSARFNSPAGIAVDAHGIVYVGDMQNHAIRKIAPDGTVSTLAGNLGSEGFADGTGGAARFQEPVGLAVDSAGNVYVADSGNSVVRKVTPAGQVTTLAGLPGQAGKTDGDGSNARFDTPYGIAVDANGTLYVADTFNHAIRRVTGAGSVATVAGSLGVSGNMDGAGGGARFSGPSAICIDATGNMFVTDSGTHTVRMLVGGSLVYTIAGTAAQDGTTDGGGASAQFNAPAGVAATSANVVYVADTLNSTIRRLERSAFNPSIPPSNTNARLINISTRSYVAPGASTQIAGFVIRGSQPKRILLRASGPALLPLGVTGVVSDPTLTLYSGSTELAQNDDWSSDAAAIETAASRAGAFGWTRGSKDAALLVTLAPGNYTAHVSGKDNGTGTALIEAYEVDEVGTDATLLNISTRSEVRTGGDIQIAGFVIGGEGSKRVLIRATGPALTQFNVPGVLADPVITVYAGSSAIAQADDWSADEVNIEQANAQAGAFPLPRGSKDAAIVLTLQPGSYTVHVRGKNDGTGIALIEVYDLQ
jgi:sugar lactone lactonase YvrE